MPSLYEALAYQVMSKTLEVQPLDRLKSLQDNNRLITGQYSSKEYNPMKQNPAQGLFRTEPVGNKYAGNLTQLLYNSAAKPSKN